MLVKLGYKEMDLKNGVTIMVKPLNVEAYQKLMIIISQFAVDQTEGDKTEQELTAFGLKQMSNTELVRIAKEVFPDHTKDLKGLQIEDDDGVRDAVVDDLFKIGSLLPLVVAIVFELFQVSNLSNKEDSDLKKP